MKFPRIFFYARFCFIIHRYGGLDKVSFIFSYLYELYWVILNVPEDANRNIYGALNSRKLQVLYVKYEKKQEPSNGLLKKDIVAPFLSRGKTPSTGVWCLEETEVFALFASSPPTISPQN